MNDMRGTDEKNLHELVLKDRKTMSVNGVKDVIGFDESDIQLVTDSGNMTIEGSGLHIKVLDVERGVVSLEGRIDGVFYSDSDSGEKRGFWGRLTK